MFSSQNSQVSNAANYIEDVFSTYLYTGNGSTQTITNGIDLSGKGGMVWGKARTSGPTSTHMLFDTARGNQKYLATQNTSGEQQTYNGVTPTTAFNFLSSGFSVVGTNDNNLNDSSVNYASWTFREQAKFFDVVTYTGTGSNTTISHSLGSVPACIMVKRTDTTGAWQVYHRSLANTEYLVLNTTAAKATGATRWNSTTPTSTVFSIGTDATVNASGGTYVAYVFAHDAGGFGLTGSDNVISCGSFTGVQTINLGYEPQWLLYKKTSDIGNWAIADNMRGLPASFVAYPELSPNLSNAEANGSLVTINATGFTSEGAGTGEVYIYIAIRRGPMKTPTTGTSVFAIDTRNSTSGAPKYKSGFVTDMNFNTIPNSAGTDRNFEDRLRGQKRLVSNSTAAEAAGSTNTTWDYMNGWGVSETTYADQYSWMFRRAPGFFDVVCYTGTGSARTVTHNLGVAPEMMIVKVRDSATDWAVYHSGIGATKRLILNLTDTPYTSATAGWNDTAPTASVFTVGTNVNVNGNGYLYVAYLFATCAGVSKVFSYTGNGSSQTINCGFTGGARWILIKRTDSTGDWYVWDSARGIVSGNDPHLSLNTTSAEVTTDDTIDTDSTGFVVNQVSATNVNVSSATYIGIAIA